MTVKTQLGLLALAVGLFCPPVSNAAIIYSIQSVAASAGDVDDQFDVFVTNTGAPVNIVAFAFEVNVSSTDVTLTKTTTATTTQTYIFNSNSLFGPQINLLTPGQLMDGSDGAASGSTTLGTGVSFGLGRVFFDISPSALSQVANLTFNTSSAASSLTNDQIPAQTVPIDTFGTATITIAGVAVPEPGGIGFVGIGLAAIFAAARRMTRSHI
jgi:hypothetical protein